MAALNPFLFKGPYEGPYFRGLTIKGLVPMRIYIDHLIFHVNYKHAKYVGNFNVDRLFHFLSYNHNNFTGNFAVKKLVPAGNEGASWRRMYTSTGGECRRTTTVTGYCIGLDPRNSMHEHVEVVVDNDLTVWEMIAELIKECKKTRECLRSRKPQNVSAGAQAEKEARRPDKQKGRKRTGR